MIAVIFANGPLGDPDIARREALGAECRIAADGGARHFALLGIVPQAIVGDMDSIEEKTLQAFAAKGVAIHRYPSRKDQTDLEIAMELALGKGATDIRVFGALGLRWDMSLASVLLCAASRFSGVRVRLMEGETEMTLVRGGERHLVEGHAGDTVSLMALGGVAGGVTIDGFEYPLHGRDLAVGSTLGVSNVLLTDTGLVTLKEGMLLCVVVRRKV